jgi:hypothetical protein
MSKALGLAAAAGSILLLVPAAGQVKITEVMDLRAAYPIGGRRGETVTVSLIGKHLDVPGEVRIEGRGITVSAVRGVSSTEARAEFSIAPDAPLGPCFLRVVGKFGITDPVPFVVGHLPEALEKEPNGSPGEAQSVTCPAVINGRVDPQEDIDCFRISARKGAPLLLAVESYVLDATHATGEGKGRRTVDPTLRVYDSSGSLVAENEDFHTPDPLLLFQPPKDGEYVLELRDLGYQGSAAASYRLTAGAVPWATSIYPAGGQRGQAVEVEVSGVNVAGPARARVEPGDRAPGTLPVAPLPELANTRPFLVGDLPERLEAEPNDQAGDANPAAVGSVFNGRLQRPGDVDAFRLTLSQGEAVTLDVMADRELHSPVDLTLSVLDAQGREVAQNDDSGLSYGLESRDPALQFTPGAAGTYTVLIRDVAGRGDPDCVYRATITHLEKGFYLTTWWDNVLIKGPGGSSPLLALVRREGGFRGPVRVRVRGLAEGFQGSEAIVTSPLESAVITLTAPETAPVGTVTPFWLEAEAEVDGRTLVKRAIPRAQRDQDGETIWRPSSGCFAAVGPVTEFQLRTETRSLTATPGDTVHIPIKIQRLPAYEDAFALNAIQCWFSLGATPAQFRSVLPVPKGAGEVDFPLPLPKDLPPGEYTFMVCRGMGHDYRIDRPYPSTPLIHLTVRAPGK